MDKKPIIFSNTFQVFIVAVVFCVIAISYFIWTSSTILSQFGGDNAIYLLTAKLFSPYSPSSYLAEYFSRYSQYPPLYPLLLGLFGGGESILIAHFVTTIFLILAIFILYKWSILMGLGRLHAMLLVIIFSIIPGTYMQALAILSENLYLMLSLSVLYVISYNENDRKWAWIAVFLIACATMTRSAGLPLVLSYIIYLFIKRNNDKYLLSLFALLPMILWGLFNNQNSASYFSLFSNHYSADYVSILFYQMIDQSIYMLSIWFRTFTNGNFGYLLFSIFAFCCLLGMFYSLYLKRIDGIYALLYLLMILAWPYPAESMRLLYPVVPVLLVQISILIKDFTPCWNSKFNLNSGNIVLELMLLVILIPNIILTISRLNIPVDEHLIPYKKTYDWYTPNPIEAINGIKISHGVVSSLKDAKNLVPDGQCVYSIKPSVIGLYMERVGQIPPLASTDDDTFYSSIKKSECEYFFMLPFMSPTFHIAFYPFDRFRENIEITKVYFLDDDNTKPVVAILARLND